MDRKEKQKVLKSLSEKFSDSQSILFTNYKGLTAQQMTQLRKSIRDKGGEYKVFKNRLALIALEKSGNESLKKFVSGACGLVFLGDQPIEIVKTVMNFSEENEPLILIGGIIEGKIVEPAQLTEISNLPSREQLLINCLGSMNAPINGLVNYLHSLFVSLLFVLISIKDKQQEGQHGKEGKQ